MRGCKSRCHGARQHEVVRLELTPQRAAELEGRTEASRDERVGGSRKKACPLGPWLAEDPAMLPCVKVPDLARFDWPAARVAGNYLSRVASAGCSLARKRHCDDGPPLEPTSNWEDRMPA